MSESSTTPAGDEPDVAIMSEATTYDVIVIGGGPAGENAADYAIRGSTRTAAIVEHELVGGECSYWACMPSKALLGAGSALAAAAAMPGAAQRLAGTAPDVGAVLARRDEYTHNRDDGSQVDWARGAGIDVVRGHGQIVGERQVAVGGRTLTAREAVVIATGSVASIPPVDGLADALPWTSRDATNLVEVPQRVAILGGGVIACEAATWLLDLGAREVTMIVRGKSLLPKAEPFVSERVAAGLRDRGAHILFGTQISRAQRPGADATGYGRIHGGPVTLELNGPTPASAGSPDSLEVDEILVAAGRKPATAGLGLSVVGLDEKSAVAVDDQLSVPGATWLYAIGDVTGRAPLTHMGKYEARVAGDVIAARAEGRSLDGERYRASSDHACVPQVVFTRPEVASVGRTEAQARADGLDVRTVEIDIAVAGSFLTDDHYAGRANIVIDTARQVLVGATFVGSGVAELVHSATVAIVGEVPVERLWHAVPSYPTISEVWLRLLEEWRVRTPREPDPSTR